MRVSCCYCIALLSGSAFFPPPVTIVEVFFFLHGIPILQANLGFGKKKQVAVHVLGSRKSRLDSADWRKREGEREGRERGKRDVGASLCSAVRQTYKYHRVVYYHYSGFVCRAPLLVRTGGGNY